MSNVRAEYLPEPSARLVDGSWHIDAPWTMKDVKQSKWQLEAYRRKRSLFGRAFFWLFDVFVIAMYGLFLAVVSLVLLPLAQGLIQFFIGETVSGYYSLTLFFVILLIVGVIVPYTCSFRQNNLLKSLPLRMEVDAQVVVGEVTGLRSVLSWKQVSDFVELPAYFVIVHSLDYYIAVPRSAFSSAEDDDAFLRFCRAALRNGQINA